MFILDVGSEADFLAFHFAEAANIPLEELTERLHELPPREIPFRLYGDSDERRAKADVILRTGGWRPVRMGHLDLLTPVSGPARVRLWRPGAFLEEIVTSVKARAGTQARPTAEEPTDSKPETRNSKPRTVLDIACGSGRDAVWLALQGFAVTAVDILPDAIAKANDLAGRNGTALDARVLDVEKEPLPPGPFDLITVVSFLQRDLFPAIRERVAPGGSVVYETFLVAHREKYGKPKRDAFLLQPGELPTFFPGWNVRRYEEGEFTAGRITARLWAVKPG